MRYIANSSGYLQEVSFGAEITCNGQSCAEYTGTVPTGYDSLEAWYIAVYETLYRWKIVDGNLVEDTSVPAPSENDLWIGDGIRVRTTDDGRGNLQLYKADGTLAVNAYATDGGGGEIDLHDASGDAKVQLYANSAGEGKLVLKDASGNSAELTKAKIDQIGTGSGTSAVESVNGKTGAVTVGVEIVDGKDITPSSVKASSGGNVVAALYQTGDGRGVLALRDKDHPNQDGVQAYALSNGGGGILTRNGDGNTSTTLSASAADMQSDAGAVVTFDASGNKRAVLGTNTGDAGTLRLFDSSGGAHDLTPAKIDQIGTGAAGVDGENIAPNRVDLVYGTTVAASLNKTSDGRGNFYLNRPDNTQAVHAYALDNGAEIDLFDATSTRRVALYTGSAGDGRLQLRGTDNVNRFLTPSLLENAPMHNYLDNSDFTNPVNQRGETSYSGSTYCIDRWRIWDDASVSITEGYSVTVTGYIFQYFEPLTLPNAICTLAVCDINGNIRCTRGNPRLTYAYDNAAGLGLGYDPDRSQMVICIDGEGAGLVWAALYRGSYEPAELPEYQPKGYAAELAECQRYFRISRVPVLPIEFPAYSGTYKLSVLFDTPMRTVPTVATYTIEGQTIDAWYVTADGFHGTCSVAGAYLVSWSASAEL